MLKIKLSFHTSILCLVIYPTSIVFIKHVIHFMYFIFFLDVIPITLIYFPIQIISSNCIKFILISNTKNDLYFECPVHINDILYVYFFLSVSCNNTYIYIFLHTLNTQ